jgi:hypothetical protein
MRLGHVRRRAHCKWQTHPARRLTSPKQRLVSALRTLGKTRCSAAGSQGAAWGFDAAIPRGPIARPATCPYFPCACPARRHVNGTGPALHLVRRHGGTPGEGQHYEERSERFPPVHRLLRPPDPPYLTRANDRLGRAGVIVLDVADPGAHRPARHPLRRIRLSR